MHFNSWGFAPAWWIGVGFIGLTIALVVLILSVVLKGYSLWTAARRGEKWWFIIIMIVNTMGILELIYLIWIAKVKWSDFSHCCEKCSNKDHEHNHEHHHEHSHHVAKETSQKADDANGMPIIK